MARWFKLDNAAKIYPPTRTRRWAAMYRLSVTLDEAVDPALLQKAHEAALPRFPAFSCRLRRGLFWYYLEQMEGTPPLVEDLFNPMQMLNDKENRHFMYRLLWHGRRIALECFHVVADGTGALTFLLSLTNEYLRLKYGRAAEPGPHILACGEPPSPEEYEDSFLRHYSKATLPRSEAASYRIRGSAVPLNKLLIISGTVPSAALAEKARQYGVSVGVFLAALLLHTIHCQQMEEPRASRRNKPVKISIPVNLRQYFPSRTMRNFSSYVNPGLDSRLGLHSFEEVLSIVKHFMGLNLTRRSLQARFSANVATEFNPLLRVIPLVLKNPALKLGFYLQGERYYASSMINLGQVKLPDAMACHITRLDAILGRAASRRSACSVISCGGSTVLNFSRTLLEAETERRFFSALVKMGIPVRIESNGRC